MSADFAKSCWTFPNRKRHRKASRNGDLAEWSNAPVLKTDEGESPPRVRIPEPPPLTLAETDDGPLWGPFFFLFQRGLAVATALRRLAKYPKSVSEPALSLTDRPLPSEGRIQKVYYFQCVGVFEGAPFSKSQAVSKYDANRGTGLRAVVLGGMQSCGNAAW